jgi:hypothetical protein
MTETERIEELERAVHQLRSERDQYRQEAHANTAQVLQRCVARATDVADTTLATEIGANRDSIEMLLKVATAAMLEAHRYTAKAVHDIRNDISRLNNAVFVKHAPKGYSGMLGGGYMATPVETKALPGASEGDGSPVKTLPYR